MALSIEQIIAIAGLLFGILSSVLAVRAKARAATAQSMVASAKTTAEAKVDEVAILFATWKDIAKDKDVEIVRLRTELKDERNQHGECSRKASRMEGQLAALMNPAHYEARPQLNPAPMEMHIDHATVDNVHIDSAKEGNE